MGFPIITAHAAERRRDGIVLLSTPPPNDKKETDVRRVSWNPEFSVVQIHLTIVTKMSNKKQNHPDNSVSWDVDRHNEVSIDRFDVLSVLRNKIENPCDNSRI